MAINKNSKKNPKPQTRSHHLHKPHSWAVVRSLFTCKHLQTHLEQPKEQRHRNPKQSIQEINKVSKKMGTEQPLSSSSFPNSPSSSIVGSLKGMPFRKLSGCYECRMVVDPVLGLTRDPSLRTTICPCPVCGQIFTKPESLELHQAVRHAVSELGQEDTSKNVVEIIFQSSWHNKQNSICKIDRILKVHNTPKVISRFEEYRDAIKAKANKKHPRCVADGNELLRFHSTTFVCSLGLNGSSNLCNSIPNCHVCGIIKNGFKVAGKGVLTTATSWTAHVSSGGAVAAAGDDSEKRAMLVCRVIAGRVKKNLPGSLEEYDSVAGAGAGGGYGDLEELYVFNPKAVLPCFVVIYSGV